MKGARAWIFIPRNVSESRNRFPFALIPSPARCCSAERIFPRSKVELDKTFSFYRPINNRYTFSRATRRHSLRSPPPLQLSVSYNYRDSHDDKFFLRETIRTIQLGAKSRLHPRQLSTIILSCDYVRINYRESRWSTRKSECSRHNEP